MTEAFRAWLRAWTDFRIEAERFLAEGDRVLVLTRYRARGRDSGVPLDRPGAHLWLFREGSVVRQEIWMSRSEALAAAGFEPPPVN